MKQILLCTLFLAGCTIRPTVDPVYGDRSIASRINSAIDASGLETNIGIHVVSALTGETQYELNKQHLFNPASNNKIYTAAAALKYLTTDYRYITTIWAPRDQLGSGKVSHLVIKGDGDPDFFPDDLDTLVQSIAMFIHEVDTIIYDDSIIDSVLFGEGWMWDEGSAWYSAQISGLSLNDNCVDLQVIASDVGEVPVIDMYPETEYVTLNNQSVVVDDTLDLKDFKITRRWWSRNNVIDIEGEYLVEELPDTSIYYRNVHDPARFTGTVFKETLMKHGIKVHGPVLKGTVASGDAVIESHASGPFMESLSNFMKESDNLSGELYIKTIGHVMTEKQGTWKDGLHSARLFFQEEVGLDTTTFSYIGGSGVSRYNYSSPEHFSSLLFWLYNQPEYRHDFLQSLPRGGWDGTLEDRMNGMGQYIYAKTGTLSGASCLSGYVLVPEKEPLVFSILMNGYVGSSKPYRDLQDQICNILENL